MIERAYFKDSVIAGDRFKHVDLREVLHFRGDSQLDNGVEMKIDISKVSERSPLSQKIRQFYLSLTLDQLSDIIRVIAETGDLKWILEFYGISLEATDE